MGVFDFFRAGELPVPGVTVDDAAQLAAELGIAGAEVVELGSQQDANFLLGRAGREVGVLKVTNPAFSAEAVDLQDLAAGLVTEAGLRAPTRIGATTTHAGSLVRVIAYLPGGTLTGSRHLRPSVVARLGDLCARVTTALADLDHPHLAAVLQWNLRHGLRTVEALAPHLPDEVRDRVVAAARRAWAEVDALDLPVQPIHGDLTDDNVVCDAHGLPDGIIDFGDVMCSWRVAELAVAIASVLHHDGATVASVLPAVSAFDAATPLTDDEVAALWPLVVLRACGLVASGHQQVALEPGHAYATAGLAREQRIFDVATAVPSAVMTALVRRQLGRSVTPPRITGSLLPEGTDVTVVDGSGHSPDFDDGGWLSDALSVPGVTVVPWESPTHG